MKTGARREAGRLLKLGRGTAAQDPESSEDPHDPRWGRKGKKVAACQTYHIGMGP